MTFDGTESYLFTYRYGSVAGGEISDAVYGVSFGGIERYSHYYDTLGRKTRDTINTGTVSVPTNYTYVSGSKTNSTTSLLNTVSVNGTTWKYEYDDNGNITKIYKNNVLEKEYTYDALGQLTKEVDKTFNRTTTYTYDKQGNILKAAATGTGAATHTYTYGDSGWKDLLTQFDGSTIAYDDIGNPTSYYGGQSFEWQNGRELARYKKNGITKAVYTYNENGIRTSKTIGIHKNEMFLSGDTLVRENPTGSIYLTYLYDETGKRYGLRYRNGSTVSYYYYIYNGQGDVVEIIDSTGATVAAYQYDVWGYPETITNGSGVSVAGNATHIANLNPFRYRGYYYDTESELYYLQSRYYDPQTGRFINADSQVNPDVLGTNLFAYCGNNPVNNIDPNGHSLFALIGLAVVTVGMAFLCTSSNSNDYSVASIGNKNKLPLTGTPNSTAKAPNGNEREYGPDGKAKQDNDYSHPERHPELDIPHHHDWEWDGDKAKRGPARNFDSEKILGVGLVVTCSIVIIVVIADDLTGIGAADNFLLGPLGTGISEGLVLIYGG